MTSNEWYAHAQLATSYGIAEKRPYVLMFTSSACFGIANRWNHRDNRYRMQTSSIFSQ